MKNLFIALYVTVISTAFTACHPSTDHDNAVREKLSVTDTFSRFISVDTANKMLGSYLSSIHYTVNDTDLQSLIINVAQLRKYLDSMPASSGVITHIKLMFAHTLPYANATTTANTYAGYQSKGLTVIVAGYDDDGNYVLYPGNMVLDYTQPCPPICPPGNAASPFLPVANSLQHN